MNEMMPIHEVIGVEKTLLVFKAFTNLMERKRNKPGTAQVGAISKAQKDSKTTFSTTGDNKSSQKTKN